MVTTLNGESKGNVGPLVTQRERGRKIKDLDALTKADKKRLAQRGLSLNELKERENAIKELIKAEEENNGALYRTGLRKAMAEKFGVSVMTVDRWKKNYRENPCLESLVEEKRGPKPGSRMTFEEEAIISYFYLFEKQKVQGPDGQITELKRRADVPYIHQVLQKFVGFTKSEDTVRRYLKKLHETSPVVTRLARHGKKFLADRIIPTLPNDVERPNMRWQIDGRPLPIYIRYKGVICTVTLLVIMDDYSQYIVRAGLYPRMILNDEGVLERADFRKEDVGILLSSAMYYSQVRPGAIYTDNGSQFISLADLLQDLSNDNEVLTRMVNTIPGRPRGRGKLERLLGLFDELLQDLPAFIRKEVGESDFDAINRARQDPQMFDFDRLCLYIQENINQLNKEPARKNGLRTREELWRETESLPAPDIRRLLRLVPESRSTDRAINKQGFLLDNHMYEPLIESDEDMYQWMVAIARGEHIPIRAVKLDEPLYRAKGDKGWKVEACLDREIPYWVEGVPYGTQKFGEAKYNEMIARAKKRAQKELEGQLAALLPLIESFDVSELVKDVITKEPLLLKEEISSASSTIKPVLPIPPEDQTFVAKRNTPRKRVSKSNSVATSKPSIGEDRWDTMPSFEELR